MKIKKYNSDFAFNLATKMIRVYVERGETIQDLKKGKWGVVMKMVLGV